MSKITRTIPINRVEGDLELRVEMDGDTVTNAWSVGAMYRGFENIMRGRGPLDGLVITPRVCGICSTSHLKAAAKALDNLYCVEVPDNALRIRNTTLGTEKLQNDVRHSILLFMCDFVNPAHASHPLYKEAIDRYEPLKGRAAVETISETSKLVEIISILGGQWPHSSFMIPGGVASNPSSGDIVQCQILLSRYRKWYEEHVLGCDIEQWADVNTESDLNRWLAKDPSHQASDLGFFLRFSELTKFDTIGKGVDNYLSFGSLEMPKETAAAGINSDGMLLPAGFSTPDGVSAFEQNRITEDIAYSWLSGGQDGLHPSVGVTIPYATGNEGDRYSWAKAPRYDGKPVETGPLAELIVAKHPLILDLIQAKGPNVFVRQLARMIRPAVLLPAIETWLREITASNSGFIREYEQKADGEGYGLIEAPRGALGHWVKIKDRKIASYQIITPTAWNASPRDAKGNRGVMEEAIIGTRVKDVKNPIEIGHIVRSFDPCLVCTVHAVNPTGQSPPVTCCSSLF